MRFALTIAATVIGAPAFAASGPFVSLGNTDFVVLVAFLIFVGIVLWMKVPSKVGEMLDARATGIQAELDEARALREEAQALLASYERKQKDVQEQADRIVANAKTEAARAAEQAKEDIRASVARRMASAEEQLSSAQAAAVKDVRDRAVTAAIGAAQDVIAAQMTAASGNALIDDAIAQVEAKLH